MPPNNEYKFVSVPLAFGGTFLLAKGVIAPYVGLSLGIDYLRIRGTSQNTSTYEDKSELKFCFSPQFGVGVHVAGPIGLLVTGSYNVMYTASTPSKYFGLNVGLAAGL